MRAFFRLLTIIPSWPRAPQRAACMFVCASVHQCETCPFLWLWLCLYKFVVSFGGFLISFLMLPSTPCPFVNRDLVGFLSIVMTSNAGFDHKNVYSDVPLFIQRCIKCVYTVLGSTTVQITCRDLNINQMFLLLISIMAGIWFHFLSIDSMASRTN